MGFLLCVSTAAGGVWVGTNDLCRLCCGSSSSAVLTGVVVFRSKTSRLFFTKRSGCIVLFQQQERIGGLGKKVTVSKYRQPNDIIL